MLRSEHSDEDLMAQYQEGSEEAFEALYSRHSGKILGYLRSRTRSEQEATDLFQEVFVKIHRSKHLYNTSLPVLPWIFSITHSILVDGQRKVTRRRETFGVDFDEMATHRNDDPHVADIIPLLHELPTQRQTALQMRYIEEKTFEEIAQRLKTSPVNIRQVISRSIKHLKNLVKEGEKP